VGAERKRKGEKTALFIFFGGRKKGRLLIGLGIVCPRDKPLERTTVEGERSLQKGNREKRSTVSPLNP